MNTNTIYKLSNSDIVLKFEKDIQITKLGSIFNEKISREMQFEVVSSILFLNKNCISIDIMERGVTGGALRCVAEHIEKNIHNMTNTVCTTVWRALSEAIEELSLPKIDCGNGSEPFKLSISIYDFENRMRFAYFMDNAMYLDRSVKKKYSDLSLGLRVKDDIIYYYLIFETLDDLKKAEQIYTIEEINNYVWDLCKEDDPYGVFEKKIPLPIVATRQQIINNGLAMGIMRNNLQ